VTGSIDKKAQRRAAKAGTASRAQPGESERPTAATTRQIGPNDPGLRSNAGRPSKSRRTGTNRFVPGLSVTSGHRSKSRPSGSGSSEPYPPKAGRSLAASGLAVLLALGSAEAADFGPLKTVLLNFGTNLAGQHFTNAQIVAYAKPPKTSLR